MPQVIIDYEEYQELLRREKMYFIIKNYSSKVNNCQNHDLITNTWKEEYYMYNKDVKSLIDELFNKDIKIS